MKEYRRHLDMNTKVTELEMTLKMTGNDITEKNYQQNLHVNRFIDTKAIQVVAAWFGCNMSVDHI